MAGVNTEKIQAFTNGQPTCFTFFFKESVPRLIVKAYDSDTGKLYYRRYIHNPVNAVNARFPVTPKNLTIEFFTENPIETVTTLKEPCGPRDITHNIPHQVERGYTDKDLKLVVVPSVAGGGPAKHTVTGPERGTIYVGQDALNKYPQQVMAYVLTHERAHTWFNDEDKADEWAFHEFMREGYNMSQAQWALINILRRTPENVDRIVKMYKLCCAAHANEKYN